MTRQIEGTGKTKDNKHDDLLAQIREHYTTAQEYYSYQREQAAEDFRFRAGEQWDPKIKAQRELEKRPCLTINQLPAFIRQVVNNQKINRPSINVKAIDANADINTAKVIQAIIKNIEEQSFAENAYDIAFDNACTGGEGYFRIITDYTGPMSFEQEILIKPIENSFSVYVDPNFKADYTDMEYAFVFDVITKAEFKRQWPDSECVSSDWAGLNLDTWIQENEVRIAEYFYIEYIPIKIALLSNGMTVKKSDLDKMDLEQDVEVVKERDSFERKVKWVKTNGYEILEETEIPGQYIPIIPVFADSYMVDGKKVFEGVVRQAKAPQMLYNFNLSAEAELMALSPKAPFMVAEGQIEGYEGEWETANTQSHPYLTYKTKSSNGTDVGPPMRNQFDPAINTIVQAKMSAKEDIKATTGIFDSQLGMDKVEASGIALLTRQRQAEATNFMYIDNLGKSLKLAGRILLGMIPDIYDSKRMIRILGDNNTPDEIIAVNGMGEKDVVLGIGKYDISITIGPYGENQRQEATESMMALMQINPAIANLIGDIFVSKQEWDGAKEIAERLKVMLPPALQKDNKELPPEIAAQLAQAKMQYEEQIAMQGQQMQQMQALIANTTAELNKVTAQLNNKEAEIISKEKIATLNARVELIKAGIKEDATDSRILFDKEVARQQSLSNPQIPMQEDTIVLPGVNDPITEANGEEAPELSAEEQQQLLQDLEQYTQPGE